MRKSTQVFWAAAAATLLLGMSARAQNAPGEDPVILTKRVNVQMVPIGGVRASSPLELTTDMPAWLKAKVTRFEAKANSDLTNGILTDSDVTRAASADGLRKTCIQEVGSSSAASTAQPFNRFGPGNNQQIVVLKGDLVNICK
jgi:hypothetical protein